MSVQHTAAAEFERHRRVLFTLAYEMLGSAASAEDIVQETWLRRQRISEAVGHERALLCRIATRLALDELRSAQARRECYPGPWLPEPIATGPELDEDLVLAEAVSQATLIVLDTLSPEERAAFLLIEVFAFSAAEVGQMLARTQSAVRQLVHRAKQRLHEGRRHQRSASTPQLWSALLRAIRAEDAQAAVRLLAPDAVLLSDGGGKAVAAPRPIRGAEAIASFLSGIAARGAQAHIEFVPVNGELALVASLGGRIDLVISVAVEAGRIQRLWIVRNPDKLMRLGDAIRLTRR